MITRHERDSESFRKTFVRLFGKDNWQAVCDDAPERWLRLRQREVHAGHGDPFYDYGITFI